MAELDDRTARAVREAYGATPGLDPAARARLRERLAAAPPPRRARSWTGWLTRPLTLRLAPLAAAGATLGLVAIGVFLGWRSHARFGPAERPIASVAPMPGIVTADTHRMVEFVVIARGASRVALVGDFNGWDVTATPMHRAGSGDSWAVTIPIAAGRHVYAFVVDGRRWLADPAAPLAPEDGFGIRNSVIVVGGSEPT